VNFVSSELASDTPLPPSTATALFRILQESLTNIVRHANASEVNVSLFINSEVIILNISDNGVGFNPETINKKKTLGILGMQERTLALGGSYKISSAEGQGTAVEVVIPVSKLRV
jgi:signal transduction histidine kinase